MTINASNNAIINYSSFNIQDNESFTVTLPDASSQILNRIIGNSISNIYGSLSCNGLFILVNTNGINIGSGANIDVARLILSTRDITDSDFLSANYRFQKLSPEQADALLLNSGNINIRSGGFGVLISGAIENRGVIIAPMGKIVLAGCNAVKLDIAGNGLISIAIEEGAAKEVLDYQGRPITDQIKNTGSIEANGGVVILDAESIGNVFQKAINLEGTVNGDRLNIKGNKDITISGSMEASNIDIRAPGHTLSIAEVKSDYLRLEACLFNVNAASSLSTHIVKDGGIYISDASNAGYLSSSALVLLEGNFGSIVYLATGTLTLQTDGTLDTAPGVILQANTVTVIASKFGSSSTPLNIDAINTNIQRTISDIDITMSQGLGTSILITGPPDGFGYIIYSASTNLTLKADTVTASGSDPIHFYGNITFYNFSIHTPGKELYFEAGHTYTFKGSLDISIDHPDWPIYLKSSDKGAYWNIDLGSTPYLLYGVSLEDSYNIGADTIYAHPARNEGHNYNWNLNTIVWTGATNSLWSVTTNWNPFGSPSGQAVEFTSGSVASTINQAYTIASLTINGYTGSLTAGANLTISGAYSQVTGTFNAGSYTLTCQNNFSVTGGTFNAGTSTIVLDATNNNILFTGNGYTFNTVLFKNTSGTARQITLGIGTFTFNGNVYLLATGSGTLTVDATTNNPNVTIAGNFGTASNLATSASASHEQGATGGSGWGASYNIATIMDGTVTTYYGLHGGYDQVLQYYWSANQTITTIRIYWYPGNGYNQGPGSYYFQYYDGGSWQAPAQWDSGGLYQDFNTWHTFTLPSPVSAQYIQLFRPGSMGYGSGLGVAEWEAYSYGVSTAASTLNAGSGTWTVGGNIDFTGSVLNASSASFVLNATSAGKTVNANSGTINNITFNGVGGGWTFTGGMTANNTTLSNGTIDFASDTVNLGSFSQSGGTFNAGSSTITMKGISFSGGTFNAGTSTIVLDASAGNISFAGGSKTFNTVVFKNTSASDRTITFGSGTFTLTGDFYLAAYGTGQIIVDASTNNPNVTIGGNLGILKDTGTNLALTASASLVWGWYGGSSWGASSDPNTMRDDSVSTYFGIRGPNGAGIEYYWGGSTNTISSVKIYFKSGAMGASPGAYSFMYYDGSSWQSPAEWSSSATSGSQGFDTWYTFSLLSPVTATYVRFERPAIGSNNGLGVAEWQAMEGFVPVGQGVINAGSGTWNVAKDINLTNVTFNGGTSTLNLNGTTTQNLVTGSSNFYRVTVSNTYTTPVNLLGNLTMSNVFTLPANITFDLKGYNFSASNSTIGNNTTIRLQGNSGQSVSGLTVRTDSGTVEYMGSGSCTGLKAGNAYYNLSFIGTGAWTLNNTLIVNNDLVFYSSTLNTANYPITIGGSLRTYRGASMADATATWVGGNMGGWNWGASGDINALKDNDTGTYIGVVGTSTGTAEYDWSSQYVINSITIYFRAGGQSRAPGVYYFMYWDGSSWQAPSEWSASATGGSQGFDTWYTFTLPAPILTSNIQFTRSSGGGGSGLGIAEWQAAAPSDGTINAGSSIITVAGNVDISNITFNRDTSTFVFNGTGTQTVTSLNKTFHNITVNKSSGEVRPQNIFTIANDLTLSAGTLNSMNYAINIAGSWTNNGGTFTPGTGTVTFNGTGAQAINGTAASQTFYNLTIAKTAGQTLSVSGSTTSLTVQNLTKNTGNFTAPASLTINGNLTLSAGTFTAGANTNIKGNWTNNGGTFTHSNGTVTFSGTGAQAINGSAASQTFYNLTIAKTAGQTLSVAGSTTTLTVQNLTETTGNFTAPATLTINGNLTVSAGTLVVSTYDLVVTGSSTVTGGTVTIGASSNTGWTTAGMTIGTGGVVTCSGASKINVSGDWTLIGTFTQGNSTVTFNGTAQTINSATSFWILVVSSTTQLDINSVTVTSTQTVDYVEGVKVTTGAKLRLDNASDSIVVSPILNNYNNFGNYGTVELSAGTISVFYQTFVNRGTLTMSGGALSVRYFYQNNGGKTDHTGGTITTRSNGYFMIEWNSTYYHSSGTALLKVGGYIYMNNVLSTTYFNDLEITDANSYINSSSSALDINGNFTIDSGKSFKTNGIAMTVAGNWTNSGTFTAGDGTTNSGTVTFDGGTGVTQLLTSGTSSPFYNFTHSGAGTLQLVDNLALANGGTLTNSAGVFDTETNSKSVTIGTSGTTSTLTFSGGTWEGDNGVTPTNQNIVVWGNGTFSGGTFKKSSNTLTVKGNMVTGLDSGSGTTTFTSGSGDITVVGDFTIQKGASETVSFTAPSGTLYVGGSWSTAASTFTHNSGTVYFNATATGKTITSNSNQFYSATWNAANPSYAWTLQDNFTQNVTNGATTFTTGTLTLNGKTYNGNTNWVQSISMGNGFTLNIGTGTMDLTWTALTVGTGATVTMSSGALWVRYLTISGTGTFTCTDAATIKSLSGLSISSPNWTPGSSTVLFWYGSSTFTLSSTQPLYNFQLGNATGSRTLVVNLGSDLTIQNNFTIYYYATSTHTFNAGAYNIYMGDGATANTGGNWDTSGGAGAVFNPSTGTVYFKGNKADTAQTINNGSNTFNNLVINNTGTGTAKVQLTGNAITVGGTFTNTLGTFDANALAVTVTGLASINGGTYSASTALQTFNDGLTIGGGTFTGSTGTVAVNGDLALSSGTFTAPSGTFTISGNWTSSGTFTAGTGTVTFNDNSKVSTISGNTTFFNLKCITPDKQLTFTAGSTQRIDGTLTLTGTAGHLIVLRSSINGNYFNLNDQGTESVTFVDVKDSNATNSTIAANSKDSGHNNNWDFSSTILTWTGTTSTRWDLATNWDLGYIPNAGDNVVIANVANDPVLYGDATVNNLTINSNGSLDINGNNLMVNGIFSNNGTLKLRGNETVNYTNDTNSGIVEYYGSGTYLNTLGAGNSYYTLSFTGTGGWKLPGDLYVTGDFNHTLGTLDHNNGTVTFNGTNQSITGSTIFNNLTKSTPGSLSFGGGSVTAVIGNFNMTGTGDGQLILQSTISGQFWNIAINNYSVNYLNVSDSRVINKTIYSLTCVYNNSIGWAKIPPQLENQINESTNVVDRLGNTIDDNIYRDFRRNINMNMDRVLEFKMKIKSYLDELFPRGNLTLILASKGDSDIVTLV